MWYLDYAKVGFIRVKRMRLTIDDSWLLHKLIEEIKNSNGRFIYIASGPCIKEEENPKEEKKFFHF